MGPYLNVDLDSLHKSLYSLVIVVVVVVVVIVVVIASVVATSLQGERNRRLLERV